MLNIHLYCNGSNSQLALSNALRYFPPNLHSTLVGEFAEELRLYGHIYMYRFLPNIEMRYTYLQRCVNNYLRLYLFVPTSQLIQAQLRHS
jgi:hypothetical protein